MIETLLEYVEALSDFLWTYVVLTMLVGCALYFTIRLHAVQFTQMGEMLRNLFRNSNTCDGKIPQTGKRISSFQAFAVSLSSRVGTGNLAGVASAIFVGGPGAVFWMWVMALLGAATAFMESTLAQLYKRRGADSFYGGPAYYMQYGLHRRWMGIIFAVFIIYGFGLANQIVQSNTICDALSESILIDKSIVAFVIMCFTFIIVFGGIQRIARFSAMVVPFMAIGYILLALTVLLINLSQVPAMLMLIVKSAFGMKQAAGGMIGITIMQGVKRGLFSNEAGEGSAPNAAATATISHPIKQGLLQSLGVFTDTLIICTCTAFIILLSGLYNNGEDGILLTAHSMQYHLGNMGRWYLTIAIFLFAYSTIVANYFYGEANLRFITTNRWAIQAFRMVTGIVVLMGGYLSLQQAWCRVDLAMALMTILNLIAVLWLSSHVFKLLQDYLSQRREGHDPHFHRDAMPEVASDLEAWD